MFLNYAYRNYEIINSSVVMVWIIGVYVLIIFAVIFIDTFIAIIVVLGLLGSTKY